MRQMVKIIRKVDVEKQLAHMLNLELDYELASLYEAMQKDNEEEIVKSKKRLHEIHDELESIQAYE